MRGMSAGLPPVAAATIATANTIFVVVVDTSSMRRRDIAGGRTDGANTSFAFDRESNYREKYAPRKNDYMLRERAPQRDDITVFQRPFANYSAMPNITKVGKETITP